MMDLALDYLQSDPLFFADMLLPLKRGTAEVLSASDDGVLLYETAGRVHIMTARDREAAERMLDILPESKLFCVHEDFYLTELERRYGLKPVAACVQAAYFKTEKIRCETSCEIRELTDGYAEFVHSRYSSPIGVEYIQGRIADREMYGAFDGEIMAGFIGTHAEGAMGLLEVFSEYRGRGIASALLAFMTNRFLDRGMTPFSQVKTDNMASYRLNQKHGFEISDKYVYWLE